MGSGSNIAHFAHLGGMLIGFIYISIKRRGWALPDIAQTIRSSFTRRKGPHLHQKNNLAPPVSESEINAILDKISLHGYSSLTQEERRKLLRAGGK